MSLETASKKRDRVYQRAFDHEEAIRLYDEGRGESITALADRFGVSYTGMQRVCDPSTRAKMASRLQAHHRKHRSRCKGGCGRLVWAYGKDRTGFCTACIAERRAAPNVRAGELRCTKCGEWKPDADFLAQRGRKTRRGRKSWCRECETTARRLNRQKNPERERRLGREYKRRRTKGIMEYVVLQNGTTDDDARPTWVEIGRTNAGNARVAIEEIVDEEGKFIAIPAGKMVERTVQSTKAFKVTA